jgi:peptidoglycan/xylan/chitin deacetylase (PgdA/CDA1 family)
VSRVAVAAYHRIGDPPAEWWSWQYVPEQTFLDQLAWFASDGWEPISAMQFVQGLDDPARLPEKALLLTFDDAYRSLHAAALPHLRRLGHPGVVFVPTGFVGGTSDWDRGAEPEERVCTWDELAELEASGISVQAHSCTHRTFSELTTDEIGEELVLARREIEIRLRTSVTLFAYPFGDDGEPAQAHTPLPDSGYRAAFRYGGGAFELADADLFRLPRLALGPDSDLEAMLADSRSTASARRR